MVERIKLTANLSIGLDQPSEADLQALAAKGVRSIVDLRQSGEPNHVLSPEAEGIAARRFGLTYRHIPVPSDRPTEDALDRVHSELARLPAPVFIHCVSGKRSGMFALVHRAINEGLTGDQMIRRAEELGVAYGSPELQAFFRRYVDQKHAPARA